MGAIRKLKKYEPTKFMDTKSKYSRLHADSAVCFVNCLKHTKGEWYGQPFKLIDWQEQIMRDVFGVLKPNGYRQFNTAYIEISKKQGKQLSLNTLIPTTNGFTTMGKIRVGDIIFDEKGNFCHVIAKSPIDYSEQAYRITFKDGEIVEAGEKHQWYGEYTYGKTKSKIINTGELFKMKKDGNLYHFRIPVSKCLKCNIEKIDSLDVDLVNSNFRYIDKIEKIPNRGMQCIQVDSPSHQYLIGKSCLPTHNSELAAAVALYLTCGDFEHGGEIYGCASDRQQASIVFDVAVDMVEQCPSLKSRIKPVLSQKRLIYKPLNSFYQVLSAEAYTKHGLNVHGVVFDELHAQPNRNLYDVMLHGSGDARKQSLFFLITTAGTDRNSVCFEVHQKAEDILKGRKRDPTFYPVIYGAPPDADWTDENVWKKANPSIGITVDIEKIRNACESAKQNPAEENLFRQLRLNQWVKQSVRWMPMEKWNACDFKIDEKSLEGRVCYGGLDLSSTTDITAFVLVFPPEDENDKYYILPYFWIPEDNIKNRVNRDHVPYDIWQKQGFLQTTEGNVVHYGFIEKFIEKLGQKYNIREIAFDRWGAVQMVQNLEGMGFTVVPFGQGFKDMSPPTKELMKLTLERKLAHGGNPVLNWMIDNIYVRTDPAGNIKADKEKSTEKIDGAIATIMALDRAIRHQNMNTESVYNERGLIIL